MVVALAVSPAIKGKPPKLNMLELVTEVNSRYRKQKGKPWPNRSYGQTVKAPIRQLLQLGSTLFAKDLRRRLLPQAYCYVCSRIDPSGIFRNPNSYLFRKGFFQACEHFPKAPYTTFVRDDIKHNEENRVSTDYAASQAAAISVTIKQGSGPISQYGTPLRRERTFGSSAEKRSTVDGADSERQRLSESISKLPPLPSQNRTLKSSVSAKTNDRLIDLATRLSAQHTTEDESVTPSVTVIPYGEGDEFSDNQSKITELSTFTKGTMPSKSTNDLDSKPLSHANVTSSYTARTAPTELSSNLDTVLQTKPYINESDGLDLTYAAEPLIRDSASLESYQDNRPKRPKAGRARERGHNTTEAVSPVRPESGHLRYHHRLEDDSVPDPGFEIPPTPSEEESLSIITAETERQEAERKLLDQQIADGNVFAGSSTGYPGSSVSDETSLRFSDLASRSKAQSRIPTQSGISGKRSFCRCPSEDKEKGGPENACQTCGKPLHHGSSTCSGRSSATRSRQYGPPPTSQGSVTTKSRQKMLYDSRRLKSKTVTDEDYMDLESIIHEDDGHYFSSDDEGLPHHFDHSPETFDRYRKRRGLPIVDPDLHKIVYLRALREAQLQRSLNVAPDIYEELEDVQHIRRPHVFSYFQIWPHAEKRLEPIGLRPPEPIKVNKGQFMKHIFGDVNVDDFYPVVTKAKAKPEVKKRVSGQTRRILPEVPKDKGASSVSLKMSKSDIRFDDT